MAGVIETPADARQAAELIAGAAGRTIEIRGGGSKRAYGGGFAPADIVLSTARLDAVIDYDPIELVLTVGAGAKLADIEALLAANGQMLGFEPPDFGPLFGQPVGATTIGGVLAANLSGPRRILAGAARDHFLGFEAVNGAGVVFKAGGRVVKNVTGFDLPKLMAGSWGTLALLTSVTLKVMPKPKTSVTLALAGLAPAEAVAAMTRAMGLPLAVAGAVHQPGLTLFRLEGFGPSVAARAAHLAEDLAEFGPLQVADDPWRDVGQVRSLALRGGSLWRLSVPPANGAQVVETAGEQAQWLIDWAGGLVWLLVPSGVRVHALAAASGGHAMLVRGPADTAHRAAPDLTARVRAAFDPAGTFALRPPVFTGSLSR